MKKKGAKTPSRREFLKTALATAGGLALTRCGGREPATPLPTRPPLDITPSASPAVPIYPDPSRPIAERVADLVDRMTVNELMMQMGTGAPPIDRLGVAKYNWWSEAGHGIGRAGLATVFPQVIGMAATWNAGLIRRTAEIISDEGRAKHHEFVRNGQYIQYGGLNFYCPNINIFRDPRWGRGQETYGEDPYLTSRLAVNFIRGMQGDDPKYLKTVATPKHFAAHSGPEEGRFGFDAKVSQQDLRMTYLPAFQACVTEGKAASVMSSYNSLNGEPCSANPTLLQEILREEWGFDGFVVADCGAVAFLFYSHGAAVSREEAAALAVRSGVDLECGCVLGIPCFFNYFNLAVQRNTITVEDLRRAVRRLFTARFRLGMFDPPEQVPYAQIPYSVVDSAEHREAALEIARQSLVLLKNEDAALPLDMDTVSSIAVIGPNADDTRVLSGNYQGTPAEPVSVLAGIRALAPQGVDVRYALGCNINDGTDSGIDVAVRAAKDCQAAVVVLGLSQLMEGEAEQAEGLPQGQISQGDRKTLNLPSIQEKLLKRVFETGTPVILVLLNGSALAVTWADENIPAILEAWYPGQAGGTAVAEALFGLTNPGGRLPVTFYRSTKDLPRLDDYSMKNRTYRYFTGRPLYPFGYGLSYTTFAYRNLDIRPAEIAPGESVEVAVEVENTGGREGDEVVQVYLKDEEASQTVPLLQLQGFARIRLAPGEKQTVTFTLSREQMRFADENGDWILEPGKFRVWVGGGQPEWREGMRPAAGLEGAFTVRG
ncbi:MAG: glycoside hydrolase family 3 C-terminal domain-containing protein [Anaerolineales bacterium]|nr:glycoside hydrolase family 3 C-terminal domain-containing protein [Anaerolineales bacterium]